MARSRSRRRRGGGSAPAARRRPENWTSRSHRRPGLCAAPASYSQTATPAAATHNVASSSSAPPPPGSSSVSAAQLVKEVGEKELKLQLPKRPGLGESGEKGIVMANHFLVELSLKDICHYDVTITPEVVSKRVSRKLISELTGLYRFSHLGARMSAYDGRKSLFTAGSLPFESMEFVVKLPQMESRGSSSLRKDPEFKVNIKLASQGDTHYLQQFLNGENLDCPQQTIQALDVVLRHIPSNTHTVVGRSFFSPELCINDDPRKGRGNLGEGLEYWRGFYQSLRPTQFGLSLNIDLSARAFYDPVLVTEFIQKHFDFIDLSRPLRNADRVNVNKAIRGLKVEVTHRECARSYKISGISNEPAARTMFTLDDGQRSISVVNYFQTKYNVVVQYPELPCLQAGSNTKPVYLLMEVCKIVPGQRYTKKLNERQVTNLLRVTCQRPLERASGIKMIARENNAAAKDLAEAFGMTMNIVDLTEVPARVLPAPWLDYHPSGRQPSVNPKLGQWNMKDKDREFKVNIKLASQGDTHLLQQFLNGENLDCPQQTIQALDVVLRHIPSNTHTVVGRSFFSPELCINDDPRKGRGNLGEGLEYWRGFYQSLRPTQFGLSLNIDLSARAFYDPDLVTAFIEKHFDFIDLSRSLPDEGRVKVNEAIRGLKVEVIHRECARSYKISGISNEPAAWTMFTLDDGQTSISVLDYFRTKYKFLVKYPELPCIQAGSDTKPVYFLMEVCKIVPGQRYTKKLNERQVTNLLSVTCQRPRERASGIERIARGNITAYEKDFAKDFGMTVNNDLTRVPARLLPAPWLNYHPWGKEASVHPKFGQWNMEDNKMIDGARVDAWAWINFSKEVRIGDLFEFWYKLTETCNKKGMEIYREALLEVWCAEPNEIEKTLADVHEKAKAQLARRTINPRAQLQLLIIILPDISGTYGRIKRVCETELGLISQCCQPWIISRRENWIQYCENVALKINVKLGGRNTVLKDAVERHIPYLTNMPTIILGADVNHPQPGDDSSPSIAAVVASMDWPEATKYRCLVSAQSHRKEIIEDLYKIVPGEQGNDVRKSMIMDHLQEFTNSTGLRPARLIFIGDVSSSRLGPFIRDGVSEGQFSEVMLYEIDAIRKACAEFQEGYPLRITFVVVQKRHHTRLFPHPDGFDMKDTSSGNILPGTVVDNLICHRNDFDFYLNSHAGIQGTNRPAHYHVLYDENDFTADGIQMLTNMLCYTYARCTRAISIVPPVKYAHLAAKRARYMEGDGTDGSSSGGRGDQEGAVEVRHLPPIKDNVLNGMFFC